ncbi:MAG: hypothetical protein GY820_35285 [Gammaproteobacteria bacterium]|nr:hypothetical protein [Gammaproteobacteria bacterium]
MKVLPLNPTEKRTFYDSSNNMVPKMVPYGSGVCHGPQVTTCLHLLLTDCDRTEFARNYYVSAAILCHIALSPIGRVLKTFATVRVYEFCFSTGTSITGTGIFSTTGTGTGTGTGIYFKNT